MLEVFKSSFLKAQQCSIPAQDQEEGRTRDHPGLTVASGCAYEQTKQQHSGRDSDARPSRCPERCQAVLGSWGRFWSPQVWDRSPC